MREWTGRDITEIAEDLGIPSEFLIPFGREKAKVDLEVLKQPRKREGHARLVLVSAITPTPAGEGKTTTSIGLADGLHKLGESTCLALREPSLGPCMGVKGGATGGGAARVIPSDSINLHFTGDFHAITAANNLLAALIDNHIHFGNKLGIDPRRILWRRVIDMNDRFLRNIVGGLGGPLDGIPREGGFDITAASEIMAMLCLSEDEADLRRRIDRTLVGFTYDSKPVLASQLNGTGALMALLFEALRPNLVQTEEGTPAFIHGGPFANIAHGCNSILATRMAMHHADWVITEAGFGFDLGAEKFFDIKLRGAGLDTACVVLVATIRALKMHGGRKVKELSQPDAEAVKKGLPNLEKHIENIHHFGEIPVVALNKFDLDTDDEIAVVRAFCQERGVEFAVADHFARGGEGGVELAKTVIEHAERTSQPFTPLYDLEDPIPEKVLKVARSMYGARDVNFSRQARKDMSLIQKHGYAGLPICIAKTQSSLSDEPSLLGRPTNFEISVERLRINAGAGFIVVLTGNIMRMPGLPRVPQAESIEVVDGKLIGVV